MDKSCHSSGDSTTTVNSTSSSSSNNNNTTDQYLRHLNKISHKISKPTTIARPTFDHLPLPHRNTPQPPPPPPQHHLAPPPQQQQQQLQQQHQPPVFNIKKSDFREVVQKLTGSPAHERFTTPPPIQPPKPPSSRLQRIRPPPLAQLSPRPPPLLNHSVPIPNPNNNTNNPRQVGPPPLSPLPPFPSVHAAAESPISAYLRYLQATTQQQQPLLPPPPSASAGGQPAFLFPSSPLPFGCFPSPRSPYALLSPSLLVSPTTAGQLGFQPFPVSPRMPVTSPRWKDI